jgi:signal peptidase I
MQPTLHPHDRIVSVAESAYKRGQVVVLKDPERHGEYLVKRIVALPGDRVEVFNGQLMINGRAVREPYIRETIEYQLPPEQVAPNEAFVLGDNRNESDDSHLWRHGVRLADIQGAVRFIYSPGERRGTQIAYPEVFQEIARASEASAGEAPERP